MSITHHTASIIPKLVELLLVNSSLRNRFVLRWKHKEEQKAKKRSKELEGEERAYYTSHCSGAGFVCDVKGRRESEPKKAATTSSAIVERSPWCMESCMINSARLLRGLCVKKVLANGNLNGFSLGALHNFSSTWCIMVSRAICLGLCRSTLVCARRGSSGQDESALDCYPKPGAIHRRRRHVNTPRRCLVGSEQTFFFAISISLHLLPSRPGRIVVFCGLSEAREKRLTRRSCPANKRVRKKTFSSLVDRLT